MKYILGVLPNELKVISRILLLTAIFSSLSKTVSNTISTNDFDLIQVTLRNANGESAKQIRLKIRNFTLVTVVSTARGPLPFKPSISLVQCQLLLVNKIMGVITNLPFCVLLNNVSSQHLHLSKHMIIGQLHTSLWKTFNLNKLSSTSTEESSYAVAYSIVQRDNKNTSSYNGVKIPAQDNYRISIDKPGDYTAYRDNFICMLEPFKSL